MYYGNPILTTLLFGLPAAFLSIIIYTTCFSDILDAKDDEEENGQGMRQEDVCFGLIDSLAVICVPFQTQTTIKSATESVNKSLFSFRCHSVNLLFDCSQL